MTVFYQYQGAGQHLWDVPDTSHSPSKGIPTQDNQSCRKDVHTQLTLIYYSIICMPDLVDMRYCIPLPWGIYFTTGLRMLLLKYKIYH